MFLLLGALAGAQGGEQTRAGLLEDALAKAAFIQRDFVLELHTSLTDEFDKLAASNMLDSLRRRELKARDVVKLMNGDATKSTLKRYFRVGGSDVERVRNALDVAVDEKNRKLYFGILLYTMVDQFDVEVSSQFCQQTCSARQELDTEQFRKLIVGARKKELIKECFGLEDKEDQKFMLKILAAMEESPYARHPLCESLELREAGRGMKKPGPRKERNRKRKRETEAGGLELDPEMPPCPFFGSNLDKYFTGHGRRFGRTR